MWSLLRYVRRSSNFSFILLFFPTKMSKVKLVNIQMALKWLTFLLHHDFSFQASSLSLQVKSSYLFQLLMLISTIFCFFQQIHKAQIMPRGGAYHMTGYNDRANNIYFMCHWRLSFPLPIPFFIAPYINSILLI